MTKAPVSSFPPRIYTLEEVTQARKAIADGYQHILTLSGDSEFRELVSKILEFIDLAGYTTFLRSYIREIRQIQGVSQLRETEASIWLNQILANDTIETARFIVQKTLQMQAYIEGRPWYILGELPAVRGSVEFLKKLREHLVNPETRARCEKTLDEWTADEVT
ncbi:hypothetical protein MUP00_06235 [Candidatus Bathyarchaeota archaeon]|jgi:hypothetical protein|nr:hypothetical protein [Candidatus Bathyarchaeota archaeon]